MPYITKADRARLSFAKSMPKTAGEGNYLLTVRAVQYIFKHGLNYKNINYVVAAFDDALHSDKPISALGKEFAEIARSLTAELFLQEDSVSARVQTNGAIRCAQLEFYRRVAVPYEDKKIAENGDVYTDVFG